MPKSGSKENAKHGIPNSPGLPESEVILSRRDDPPALILASRRSRRMRACFWVGDSSRIAGLTAACGSIGARKIHG